MDTSGAWRVARESAVPYLTVIVFAVLGSAFLTYVVPVAWSPPPTFKGQAPSVIFMFIAFAIALLLWLVYRGRRSSYRPLTVFLIALTLLWVLHFVMDRVHGGQNPYTFLLAIPILLMVLLKTPSASEAWRGIMVFGWLVAIMLVVTRLLEMANVLPMYYVSPDIINFDKSNYWLPFSGHLGLDGRWTGPFVATNRTGFMAAILLVIGVGRWSRSSWVFTPVAILTLIACGSRAAYLAAFVGLAVLLLASRRGLLARVPNWLRVAGALVLAGLGAAVLYEIGPGSTGRQDGLWPIFLTAWHRNEWFGVGKDLGSNIPGGSNISEAHSMVVGELAGYGILGLIAVMAVIAVGLVIAIKAAARGFAVPAAILASYVVTAQTDVLNDWLAPSYAWLLVVLAVVAAGVSIASSGEASLNEPVTTSDDVS